MSAKETLIKFMWRKNEILKERGAPVDYFIQADANAIRRWSDASAMFALSNLVLSDDDANMCPFCMIHSFDHCDVCEYGANHGMCTHDNSNYKVLIEWVKEELDAYSLGDALIRHKNELDAILKEGAE